MSFVMRKREREQGLSEVELLARACRKFRRKCPENDFNSLLIMALNDRRCFGKFRFYRESVWQEFQALDQTKQSTKMRRKRGLAKREDPPPDQVFESVEEVDPDNLFLISIMGPDWFRLDPRDRSGTLRAALARRDHLVPPDDR